MKHLECEKGPAIFKEEIVVEEDEGTPEDGSERPDDDSDREYVPEITGVEYDAYQFEQRQSPEFVVDVNSEDRPIPSPRSLNNITVDAYIDVHDNKQIELKPETDFGEDYGFKIPHDAFMTDRQFGVDMSVRTEDEVSELPESEIASLISDRRPELERRDSDVSLSDREYSDKDDENVVISDTDSDSPFTAKQVINLDDGQKVKTDYSEEKPDRKSSTSSSEDSDSVHEEPADVKSVEQEYLDESFDESESIGAIPARVFGDQYMQEVNRLRDESNLQVPSKELEPERNITASEGKSSESSSSDSGDDEPKSKKPFILDAEDTHEIFATDKELFEPGETDQQPMYGGYQYGKGLPVPKLQLKRESSDSESDVPVETDESMFDVTTDLETTVDLEASVDKIESPDGTIEASDRDTPSRTTDDDSSTIKEEFITHVDSLERTPTQLIEIKDYASSSEDEGLKAQLYGGPDDRGESPDMHTGFVADLELSRITEDEEPESDEGETSDTDSTTSAESVRQVDITPVHEEVLHTVDEVPESVNVSIEVPHERELSDTSFNVDESYSVEGPLAKSTLVPEKYPETEVIVQVALLGK